ncbi:MAG: SOS response-associated peptidase [Clostridia bacterium]|nr:SOS response-associated peptidase [Clostridia bacterium]
MCGRYTTGTEVENIRFREIMDEANRTMQGENEVILRENGDVYPGDVAPVMLTISSKSMFTGMRWGFDFDGKKVINARSETAHEKPAFRQSLAAMRCLVPVMGYYEWNARKEKFLFTDPNGDIFYLAGLYRFGADGFKEFSILTRDAYGEYGEIHDRMPLIIREKELWLRDASQSRRLLAGGGDIKLDIICQSSQQISMF